MKVEVADVEGNRRRRCHLGDSSPAPNVLARSRLLGLAANVDIFT